MTTDYIAALHDALAADHTPLPWIGAGPSFGDPLPRYTTAIVPEQDDDCGDICNMPVVNYRDPENEANAALIVAAVNAAPALLAEVERLSAALHDMTRDRDSWQQQASDRVDDALKFGDERDAALEELAAARVDAERYRWLTDDHENADVRKRVTKIALVIQIRGKGATDAAIDAARTAA